MYSALRDVHFHNIPIFRINVIKDSGNNSRVKIWNIQAIDIPYYGALFFVNNIVHDAPVVLFSLIDNFSEIFEIFAQNISDASRLP